jgi:hypothetical protein
MTGKDHFDRAELLAEQPAAAAWAAVDQVHATLALDAATEAGPGSSAAARPSRASAAATPHLRPDAVPDRNSPF